MSQTNSQAAKGKKSAVNRLTERSRQYPSESRLIVGRNFAFGGAAASLVVLSEIIQVGAKDLALQISVIASCISIPMWISVGAVHEFFIFLGKRSYPFIRKKAFQAAIQFLAVLAGLSLYVEIGAAAWYLSPTAAIAFFGSSVIAWVVGISCWVTLALWWYAPDGPGGKEDGGQDEQEKAVN